MPWLRRAATALAVLALVQAPARVDATTAGATTAGATTADAALPAVAVQAPHHGDVLFHLFQGRSFSALSSLMVSQHFARLAPHDDEAEVLRGGLLLGWGLHEEARAVFMRLIEHQAPPRVRDRAWFFLARLQHQRGHWAEAEASLARIGAPLVGGLEDEHQLLRAQLRLLQGDLTRAAAVLEALINPLPPRQPAMAAQMLARFNLAVALLHQGGDDAVERGTALLEQLGATPSADEEQRAIRDRANLALGFAALKSEKPREARAALQRVRLEGAMANQALLGHGWAAAALNDPRLALVAWTELAGRERGDAAVLEAQIAVPYAMSELGAYAAALGRYRQAVALFDGERRALDDAIAAIRAGALVQGLTEANPDDEHAADAGLAAFARIDRLPAMPHGSHLRPLLADHPFQETYKHLRDLRFLQAHLGRWQARLDTYRSMLDERRAAFAERLPRVREAAGAAGLPALDQRRLALAAELAAAQARGDGVALADAAEQALRLRLQRSQRALAAAAAAPGEAGVAEAELASLAERLKRVEGALTWQLAQRAAERSWPVQRGLRDAGRALDEARERDVALLRAQAAEPERHARLAARIDALAARIQALQPQVLALQAESGQQLAELAVAELQGQQERLRVYAAQAQLAIAQILDRAPLEQGPDAPATGGPR